MNKVLNKMKVYVIGTVCILCVFSYILIYKPMYDELTKSKQQCFIHSVEAVGYAVEIFMDNIIDDANSLSSRTMIKKKLIDYKDKTVSLEELEQYTTSRYYDGYNVLKRATGAFRVVDGNIITQHGDVDLSKAEHVEDITDVKLVLDTHDLSATVYSPIKEAGEILGYDIVFFNMAMC